MSTLNRLQSWSGVIMAGTLGVMGFFANPSQAGLQDMSCGQIQDAGQWCGEYLGEYGGGTAYRIEYTNPGWNEKETMTVVCDRRNVIDWESNGNLTQSQADWVATEFCALPEG